MECLQQFMAEAVEFIKDWRFTARSNNVRVVYLGLYDLLTACTGACWVINKMATL